MLSYDQVRRGEMIPLKTISIHQYDRACPVCAWKPHSDEGSAMYEDLINHVMKSHGIGKPIFKETTIFVNGIGAQKCEVAIFTNLDRGEARKEKSL